MSKSTYLTKKENIIHDDYVNYKMKNNDEIYKKMRNTPRCRNRRYEIWNMYIGHNISSIKCGLCNTNEINVFTFDCAHVVSKYNGGTISIFNIRPICKLCNASMETVNMDRYIRRNFIKTDIIDKKPLHCNTYCKHIGNNLPEKQENIAIKLSAWNDKVGIDVPEVKCAYKDCKNIVCMQTFEITSHVYPFVICHSCAHDRSS